MRSSKPRSRGSSTKLLVILGATAALIFMAWLYLLPHGLRTGDTTTPAVSARARVQNMMEVGGEVNVVEADVCAPGLQQPHVEYWGSVVKAGTGSGKDLGLSAATARDCCMSCKSTRGCNIWVWCSNPASCATQCWLKRVGSSQQAQAHSSGDSVPWVSGSVPKDYDRDVATLPAVDTSISEVALRTAHGPIRIRLRPDWSDSSVEFVRRMAMSPELCTPQCEFYRAEPAFLLQGSLRGFIPPNSKTTPGPKFMERGEIGWAGGSAGPDFFIYLGDQPASHWGTSHTVWGVIADPESMLVVEKIVMLPAEAPKPGEMHMMVERVALDIAVAKKG